MMNSLMREVSTHFCPPLPIFPLTGDIVLIRQNLRQFFYPGFVNGPKFTGVWWGAGVDEWAALN